MQLEDVITGLPHIVRDQYQKITGEPDCLISIDTMPPGELNTLIFLMESEPHLEMNEPKDLFQFRKETWARALAELLCIIEKKQMIAV